MPNFYLRTVISNLMLNEISSQQIKEKNEQLVKSVTDAIESLNNVSKRAPKAQEKAREKLNNLLDELHETDHRLFDAVAKANGLPSWEEWDKQRKENQAEEPELEGPVSIKKIESTNFDWRPWSKDAANIYNPEKAKSKLESQGREFKKSGPGEYSVVEEFGDCEVMGSGYDYDIRQVFGGNTKWEVKEVDSGRLRTSIHGIVASAEPRHELNTALKKIQKTIINLKKDTDVTNAALSPDGKNSLAMLISFIERNMETIFSKAEITTKLIGKLMTALKNAQEVKSELSNFAGSSPNTIKVGDTEPVAVSNSQFQKIMKILGSPVANIENTGETDLQQRAASYVNELDDATIENPETFIDQVEEKLSPEKSFGPVNGVILVTPTHYCVVLKNELKDILDFDGITQGGRTFYSLKQDRKAPGKPGKKKD